MSVSSPRVDGVVTRAVANGCAVSLSLFGAEPLPLPVSGVSADSTIVAPSESSSTSSPASDVASSSPVSAVSLSFTADPSAAPPVSESLDALVDSVFVSVDPGVPAAPAPPVAPGAPAAPVAPAAPAEPDAPWAPLSARASPGLLAIAALIPSATASAPTLPMNRPYEFGVDANEGALLCVLCGDVASKSRPRRYEGAAVRVCTFGALQISAPSQPGFILVPSGT